MSKETKQDRLVRLMKDNVTEHIIELKHMEANPNCKELDIERWVQMVLKSCLGYSATNEYSIRAQEQKGKHRPDLVIYKKEVALFVVEVKKMGFDFNKSDFRSGKVQLQEYLFSLGKVPYGILCNGHEWKLYDFNNANGVIEIFSFDIRNDEDKIDTSKKSIDDICYDLATLHEAAYTNKEWTQLSKEATAFSPESLSKAILSANVIKLITKEIRGEHEYKVCTDILFQKVYDLLANGLDDSLKDFNDVKKLEFQKYIKGQMRSTRKATKKTATKDVPPSSEIKAETAITEKEVPVIKDVA